MQSLSEKLDLLVILLDDAQCIANHLDSLRQKLTEAEFEAIYDSPLDSLFCSCMDLESTLDKLR